MEGVLLSPLVLSQVFDNFEGKNSSWDSFRVISDGVVVLRNPVEVWSVIGFLSSLELDSRCSNDGGNGEHIVPGSDCTKELQSVKGNQELKRTDLLLHL